MRRMGRSPNLMRPIPVKINKPEISIELSFNVT